MSRKRTTYSTELKTKLVLELLKEEKTLVEIAKENGITANNLKNWKKIFLDNAEMVFTRIHLATRTHKHLAT